ncbi:MAG: efflux RND transporter permease subunit [Pseudomonadota bacterium]
MNPADFALRKQTLMVVITLMLTGLGIIAYNHLGRLEDPTFTIKTALVVTQYPGAGPLQVENEVTALIEETIKSMGEVKEVRSTSQEGVSFVFVDMKDTYTASQLPQIWDGLRKKVRDIRNRLPPGAGPSMVNDDFGDVYGIFFAVTGKGYTPAQLKDYAEDLKKELLLCDDVAKIDFWGTRQEAVFVEFSRAKLAEIGIPLALIAQTLETQNTVEQSGRVNVDSMYMRITPTGEFGSETMIADTLIGGAGGMVRLGDIARVYRGFTDPPGNIMRYNGQDAIGIGISTVAGGNVITMGNSVLQRLKNLEDDRPPGMELHTIYFQSDIVQESVKAFVMNLVEAVVIVIGLLMLFMGWQTGLLIGMILILTILATFLGMFLMDIDLQKISLGALILALGMLVDNAIVVADGILVRVSRGETREKAAREVVRETMWPLLGATVVAVLAFTAIGFAKGNVGEYCRSLFDVMAMSLMLSWIFAVTITPLLCVWFLRIPGEDSIHDLYDRPFYRIYRSILSMAIRYRWFTAMTIIVMLAGAVVGFRAVPDAFFSPSTQRYFYINYWKPQGTHINRTTDDVRRIEDTVMKLRGVRNITSFVGEGALRFVLSYDYQIRNSSYAQMLVEVNDYRNVDTISGEALAMISREFPDSEPYITRIVNGPPVNFLVEARFRGPDIQVLQDLAGKAMAILRDTPNTRDVRTDWRQPTRVIKAVFSETQARSIGVSRSDLSRSLQWNFNGITMGLYREQDKLIPILGRPPEPERTSVENLGNVQVWSSINQAFVPIRQVMTGMDPQWENPLIKRREQQRAITVQCNPVTGLASPLRNAVKGRIEAIPLPLGYTLEWAGEYKESADGQAPLRAIFPICILGMFVTVVWLFNSVRRPLLIFFTVPLSLVGVACGLLLMKLPFGFMAILGFLGLSGMLIKNAIVLIEQIEIDLRSGSKPLAAVMNASVSRVRPVTMASGTTILGMAPLVVDPLFGAMAVTIMGGLLVATVLTLIVVPVLYCLMYGIRHSPALPKSL